jgi:hypothetical protein
MLQLELVLQSEFVTERSESLKEGGGRKEKGKHRNVERKERNW